MSEENKTGGGFIQKVDSIIFPLLALAIGVGYIAGIFINNPVGLVLSSPRVLIIIAVLAVITFFPIRSICRTFFGGSDSTS